MFSFSVLKKPWETLDATLSDPESFSPGAVDHPCTAHPNSPRSCTLGLALGAHHADRLPGTGLRDPLLRQGKERHGPGVFGVTPHLLVDLGASTSGGSLPRLGFELSMMCF